MLGLIGESGAGKSTIGLAAMAYGRGGVRITGGEVFLNGRDILRQRPAGLRAAARARGLLCRAIGGGGVQPGAQADGPGGRIRPRARHREAAREAERRAVGLFEKLGLPDPQTIGARYPHQVSGGQLQRVMTAMALCSEPDLIVFDEPTTALDVTTQIDVLAAIKDAIRGFHVAALYITHDLAVVAQVSDDIMVLRNGEMVE